MCGEIVLDKLPRDIRSLRVMQDRIEKNLQVALLLPSVWNGELLFL